MSNPQAAPFPYSTNPAMIPTVVLKTPRGERPRIVYQCPDSCWTAHLEQWRKLCRERIAPEPMPFGHLMFDRPETYGYVRLGDESEESHHSAITARVRGDLSGWTRGVPEQKVDDVVQATVAAKLAGAETGPWPFFACLAASLA